MTDDEAKTAVLLLARSADVTRQTDADPNGDPTEKLADKIALADQLIELIPTILQALGAKDFNGPGVTYYEPSDLVQSI